MMIKFSKIGAIYNVAKYVKYVNTDEAVPTEHKVTTPVSYRGTVKLHGTNSGVLVRGTGECVPQSRNRVLSVDNDNMGFAKFAAANESFIRGVAAKVRAYNDLPVDQDVVLYGEWIGPGVQSKVAITQLPEKQWVLFAARAVVSDEERPYLGIDVSDLTGGSDAIHSIFDGPVYDLTIDFSDEKSREQAVEKVSELTQRVDAHCPWADRFGISGAGEGIVWMPQGMHWGKSDLMFKSKGEKHKVTKEKSSKVSMDPETVKSIEEFVEFAVTDNRLQQGVDHVREMGKPIDMSSTKHFLGWLGNDVRVECQDNLEASGLEWKQVARKVNDKALAFWKEQAQQF